MGHISAIAGGSPLPKGGLHELASFSGFASSSKRAEALQDVASPVVAMAADFPSDGIGTRHSHRRTQLMHSISGVMTVITDQGSWTVSPQHALIIPGGVMHQTRCWGEVQLRALYVEPGATDTLPKQCRRIKVSPLVRALINEAVTFRTDYDICGREGQIMSLILAEIGRTPAEPLGAPMPRDKRLTRICEAILRDPGSSRDLEYWAQLGGLGRRTLTRLFRRDTGLSFGEWRQQVRLMEAMSRLTMRESVTNIALDLGYESPSAFSAMFRRAMGVSPREYLRWAE